jgi:hypothetical protein
MLVLVIRKTNKGIFFQWCNLFLLGFCTTVFLSLSIFTFCVVRNPFFSLHINPLTPFFSFSFYSLNLGIVVRLKIEKQAIFFFFSLVLAMGKNKMIEFVV